MRVTKRDRSGVNEGHTQRCMNGGTKRGWSGAEEASMCVEKLGSGVGLKRAHPWKCISKKECLEKDRSGDAYMGEKKAPRKERSGYS